MTLPSRHWNRDPDAALEPFARDMERQMNTGESVHGVDRAALRSVYRFLVIDNHDPGDEDWSER